MTSRPHNPEFQADRIEVALFPIPDVVAFPGMIVPLHVFEPRYRQLIHDSMRDQRMVAVSHVVKTIHQPKNPAELLNSNQATYKPHTVFSAGHCRIVEEAADGRLAVTVTMTERLTMIEEVQSLPYRIVHCARVADEEDQAAEAGALQSAIHRKLIEVVRAGSPDLAADLEDDDWSTLDPGQYSLKIFRCLRLDPEIMQTILESRSANARLELIWTVLQQA